MWWLVIEHIICVYLSNKISGHHTVHQSSKITTTVPGGSGATLEAQIVKNLPAMQETQFQSLSQADPLEMEKATHSSILAEKSHEQRSLKGYSHGVEKSQTQLSD